LKSKQFIKIIGTVYKKLVNQKLKVASMFSVCGGMDFAFYDRDDVFNIVYSNDFDKDSLQRKCRCT